MNQKLNVTVKQAYETITLARSELVLMRTESGRRDSAKIALDDALTCYAKLDLEHARARALTSLRYSVGIFHPTYTQALALL